MLLIFYGVLFLQFALGYNSCSRNNKCMLVSECPYFQEIFKASPKPSSEVYRLLKELNCGYDKRDPMICCPASKPSGSSSSTTTQATSPSTPYQVTSDPSVPSRVFIPAGEYREVPPSIQGLSSIDLLPSYCGDFEDNKIFNGNITGPLDYPWMAILSYDDNGTQKFLCAGTIINDRYILTAAHCISSLNPGRVLMGVRVGEHDLSSSRDCEGSESLQYCASPHQDIEIENIIPHRNYNASTFQDDIGLIRLGRPIDFTRNNVIPICLPTSSDLMNSFGENRIMKILGWGTTENRSPSQKLLQADIPIINNTMCGTIFNSSLITGISFKQMCAGGNSSRTCAGDSGGPIIAIDYVNGVQRYVQYGITSFGHNVCHTLRPIPSVFTRISYYMNWILNQLEA